MKQLGPLLAQLHDLEAELAEDLRAIGERHAADHDVYHQCRSFATSCEERARRLAPHAARYGQEVDEETGPDFWSGLLERARHKGSELLGRTPSASVLLLRDLRTIFLAYEEVSITWVMAEQAAKAIRDRALLDVVTECHSQAQLEMKWFVTKIKTAAPQALAVG
jgi:hypothetical protein